MKIHRVTKKMTAFLLAAVIMLVSMSTGAAAVGSRFTGRFYSDILSDISGIKLDIYSCVLSQSSNDFEKYDNNYLFSVYTDKKGQFSFDRPSNMFIIKADMSTLPKKTGITENMWTVADNRKLSLSADVNGIKYINIDSTNIESGDIKVDIFSADNSEIFCNYTVNVSDTEITEAAKDESGKRTYRTERTITVKANGMKKTQLLVGEFTETAVPVVSLTNPDFEIPAVYTESGGFFAVHYDKAQYSDETVKNVYDTFADAKAFYDRNGFNAPIKDGSGGKYNVYLKTSGGAAATTKHVKKGSSYIIMQTPTDYRRDNNLYYNSAIAHELFHAVMYTYTRAYGINPPKWFREAFANWAGNQYISSSTNTLKKYVNIFQSNPELSLTDTFDSRVYGSTLFPLTISEYFGGMNAIKQILLQFKNIDPKTADPEMDAISKGLYKVNKTYSRTKAFIKFAINNMYPSHFYSLRDSSKWDNAARCSDTLYGGATFRDLQFRPLSVKYYDAAPVTTADSVIVTVTDNAKRYTNIAFCCVIKRSDGSYAEYSDVTKRFCTYKIKNFKSSKASLLSLGIVNVSTSRSQDITVKIAYA